ncbi:MAG: hypothetical protein HKO53_20400 [Gemmatimonadetes bacterium]|nr:hypothetical protein [Gemmatimonadota bacterium]
MRPARIVRDSADPFRIAVFGDFSGGAASGRQGTEDAPITPLTVDRDDLDEVLRGLGPSVSVSLDEASDPLVLSFDSIWDFQPEELEARLPLFRELRGRIEHRTPDPSAEPPPPDTTAGPPAPAAGGGVLDAVLSATDPNDMGPSSPPTGDLAGLIEEAIAPYLVTPDAHFEARRSAYEVLATDFLRRILRDPDYRALESLWRGLHLLTQRLETGPHLKIHLFDVPKSRLRRELRADGVSTGSLRHQLLPDTGAPGANFAVLAGCYTFDATEDDLALLAGLGELGQMVNAPWVLEGTAELANLALGGDPESTNLGSGWKALRESSDAAYLSMLMPRFRQRLPFSPSAGHDPPFFVELEGSGRHEDHLWGSPVFLAALVMGQAFTHHGWQMRPAAPWDVPGLPLLITKENESPTAHPCAEVSFGDGEARSLIEAGITPLMAVKNQDRIRVPGVHPIGPAPFPLGGRWLGT